jgi:hypothetical protein
LAQQHKAVIPHDPRDPCLEGGVASKVVQVTESQEVSRLHSVLRFLRPIEELTAPSQAMPDIAAQTVRLSPHCLRASRQQLVHVRISLANLVHGKFCAKLQRPADSTKRPEERYTPKAA